MSTNYHQYIRPSSTSSLHSFLTAEPQKLKETNVLHDSFATKFFSPSEPTKEGEAMNTKHIFETKLHNFSPSEDEVDDIIEQARSEWCNTQCRQRGISAKALHLEMKKMA